MWVLSIAVVILLIVIIYLIVVKPAFNKYTTEKQIEAYNQGVEDAVVLIIYDIAQKGYTQIQLENQTMYITEFNPQG